MSFWTPAVLSHRIILFSRESVISRGIEWRDIFPGSGTLAAETKVSSGTLTASIDTEVSPGTLTVSVQTTPHGLFLSRHLLCPKVSGSTNSSDYPL